jgi:hypothetical protein
MCSNGLMRIAVSAGLVALLPLVARAEVDVTQANGRVDLKATAAPVSEVLDRLGKQTGMKVTYEGSPVRQPVTVTLLRRTPAEAVLGVLDGLGLNYALRMDLSGARVEALMIFGVAAAGGGSPSAPPMANTPVFRPLPTPDAEPDDDADTAEDHDAPPESAPKAPATPQPGQPRTPVTAPGAPGAAPHPSGLPTTGPMFPVSPFTPTAPTLPQPQAPTEPQPPPPPGGDEESP